MQKEIVKKYPKNYINPQVDCRALAVTNILNYDGGNFDNEIVFTLCGGLDIWKIKTSEYSKICIFITRNMDSEIRFLKRLGYKVTVLDGISNNKLSELLQTGKRIIIDLDRYYLPDYTAAFGSQHFGFHCCNLIGVSENDKRYFYAYEFLREEHYSYSDELLKNARFSKCEIHSPNARTYIIENEVKINQILNSNFYYKNLLDTARIQLESSVGIAEHYKEIISYLMKISTYITNPMLERLGKSQLNFVKLSIQKSDASGTGYRLIHAKGLKKISKICNDKELNDISDKWEEISKEWKHIGQKNLSEFSLVDRLLFYLSFFEKMADKEIALYHEIVTLCEKRLFV